MRYGILADIHSNLEALEAVLDYAPKARIDFWAVLGDVIGYGANPNECFRWAMEHAGFNLMGNHEKAVVDPAVREWFTDWARDAIDWTGGVLEDKYKSAIRELPFIHVKDRYAFVHATLHEPERFHYLLSLSEAAQSFEIMSQEICFVGHTHVPACFQESTRAAMRLSAGILPLKAGDRYILNPGSAGQPRDRDPRLSFGILDDVKNTFEIVRLPYDNVKAAEKIRKAGLPRYLADRLL